jgi:hypothetical protein
MFEVLRRSTMFIVRRFLITLRSSGAQSVFASWDYMPLLTERDSAVMLSHKHVAPPEH